MIGVVNRLVTATYITMSHKIGKIILTRTISRPTILVIAAVDFFTQRSFNIIIHCEDIIQIYILLSSGEEQGIDFYTEMDIMIAA